VSTPLDREISRLDLEFSASDRELPSSDRASAAPDDWISPLYLAALRNEAAAQLRPTKE